MHRFIFFACMTLTFGIFGALPPFAQSVKELKALLSDERLEELLGSSEGIREIMKTDSGYAVVTYSRFLKVDVEYKSLGHPGPVPFEFHFFEPIDLTVPNEQVLGKVP
jgi:hypothetical protein